MRKSHKELDGSFTKEMTDYEVQNELHAKLLDDFKESYSVKSFGIAKAF